MKNINEIVVSLAVVFLFVGAQIVKISRDCSHPLQGWVDPRSVQYVDGVYWVAKEDGFIETQGGMNFGKFEKGEVLHITDLDSDSDRVFVSYTPSRCGN